MNMDTRTRERQLTDLLKIDEDNLTWQLDGYYNRYHKVVRGSILQQIATLHEHRGLKAYFIENNLKAMKQQFHTAGLLLQASQKEGWGYIGNYTPFLYGLLSDSPEIVNWLMHAVVHDTGPYKGAHNLFRQYQLLLLGDAAALRESITIAAQKAGKHDRKAAAAGVDLFSLILKRDKAGLEALIGNQAKIKSDDKFLNQFIAGLALISAKLCWIKGIDVEIKNPLVPMPLLPVQPLDHYEIEYDFLRQDWIPPKPSLMDKFKRLLK